VGKVNSFAYRQALDYYKEDVESLDRNLFFQQDGARPHTADPSTDKISLLFQNKLPFWPANSPDLSPIEPLWAIVKD